MESSSVSVAWITGSSSGIGFAIAESLADAGHLVVLSARQETLLCEACESLRGKGRKADYVAVDVMVQHAVEDAYRTILRRHKRIDVLVNCAGFNVAARQWHELNPDEFDKVISGNLSGTFYAIHAVLPLMRAQRSGVIINIASMAGKNVTIGGGVAYTIAKQAVITLTQTVNMAEFRNGIRACAISPGETATPAMQRRATPPPQDVLERMLKPEDVARAVRFVVETPAHACVYEIVLSPTWNRGWL
jgi:NADP-dependent 3-hydroxy acid dehydrogenase YdfG